MTGETPAEAARRGCLVFDGEIVYDPRNCPCGAEGKHEWCDGPLEYMRGCVARYCKPCLIAKLEAEIEYLDAALTKLRSLPA